MKFKHIRHRLFSLLLLMTGLLFTTVVIDGKLCTRQSALSNVTFCPENNNNNDYAAENQTSSDIVPTSGQDVVVDGKADKNLTTKDERVNENVPYQNGSTLLHQAAQRGD